MKKKVFVVEKWKSSAGNREDHFFADDRQTYMFGYNPKILTKKQIKEVFKILGIK